MTLEAWVNPSTVIEQLARRHLQGQRQLLPRRHLQQRRPTRRRRHLRRRKRRCLRRRPRCRPTPGRTSPLTYDGATLRLYVNGTLVGSQAKTGAITTSTNPLQIGGDSIYGQYFKGLIDEVRIYNVALAAAQIQTDMNTPVGSGGGRHPAAVGAGAP